MPEVNIPLMRKVLEHITAHPDEHDQTAWGVRRSCGTQFCMAGWAIVLSGGEPIWEPIWEEHDEDYPGVYANSFRMPGAMGLPPDALGAGLLGLNDDQAAEMFEDAFYISELWELAADFTGGEIRRP